MNPCRACALPLPQTEVVCPRCGESVESGWAAEPALTGTPSWAVAGDPAESAQPLVSAQPAVSAPPIVSAQPAVASPPPVFTELRSGAADWPVQSGAGSQAGPAIAAAAPAAPQHPTIDPGFAMMQQDPSRTVIAGRTPTAVATQHTVPRPVGPRLTLRGKLHGGLTGTEFRLLGTSVVGRFDPARGPVDVDLSSLQGAETVSRRHGQIVLRADAWWVEDLRSANGVFVRTAAMTAPVRVETAQLVTGDEVSFGNVTFVAVVEDPPPQPTPAMHQPSEQR